MLERVVTGGQSGSDLAGWRAARAAGIATGGWMIGNYWTEDGDRPEFAEMYGATLLPVSAKLPFAVQLRKRSEANAVMADATLCFDLVGSKATWNAHDDCEAQDKPFRCVLLRRDDEGRICCSILAHEPQEIAEWIHKNGIKDLNVCGNRESKAPGIGSFVEAYLTEVFRLLKETVR